MILYRSLRLILASVYSSYFKIPEADYAIATMWSGCSRAKPIALPECIKIALFLLCFLRVF
ncbi:MAG: hypothetical protein LBJ00_10225 [Planctomycetaceae bacterium]|nr:hypothetical protein [Planctomycetaceae bacterium]